EGNKDLLDYSMTKGGIHAFTRSLSESVLDRGIRVNAVAPGPVWTPLNPADKSARTVAAGVVPGSSSRAEPGLADAMRRIAPRATGIKRAIVRSGARWRLRTLARSRTMADSWMAEVRPLHVRSPTCSRRGCESPVKR
ncbi:MAG TPA: SDR family oxidoreductase, partial [Candidatus Elarobacter sp.]|nr:SDR family oxidoreductase [Candidatus Elarobacter sp.]